MVEQFSVQKPIASPHPLKQLALDAVVEKPSQIPGGNAALPEKEPQTNVLNAGKPTTPQETK